MATNCLFCIWGQLIWDTCDIICRHKHSQQQHKQGECCYRHINLCTKHWECPDEDPNNAFKLLDVHCPCLLCLTQFKNNINMVSNHRGVLKLDLSYGHVFHNEILLQQESSGLLPCKQQGAHDLSFLTLWSFSGGTKLSGPQVHLTSWGLI